MRLNGKNLPVVKTVDLSITKVNEVYIHIDCEDGISRELREHFTFEVPNFKFMPKYKSGLWDGKIRLFQYNNTIYLGLIEKIKKFCDIFQYTYEIEPSLLVTFPEDATSWIKSLDLYYKQKPIEAYWYQIKAVNSGVQAPRSTFECPTGSGKSLMIYAWLRWFLPKTKKKLLLIVPSQQLVEQMYSDFNHYSYKNGWDTDKYCYRQYSGQEKQLDKKIWITTWQSIYKQPTKFFDQFEVCIGDEAHHATAQSLTNILTRLEKCPVKIGTTGSLSESTTHKLVVEGLFGPIHKVVNTKQLMDEGYLANLKIKCVLIRHNDTISKQVRGLKYAEEIKFLMEYQKRNNFVKKLALSLQGNTLILFNLVDTHGKILYNDIKNATSRPVYIIHGKAGEIKAKDREIIREQMESESDAILLASYGVFSTGVNIKNLQNLILAHPFKSQIRILQSIGRVLRLDEKDNEAVLYDIADNCSLGKTANFTLKHWMKRMELYNQQDFDYEVFNFTF